MLPGATASDTYTPVQLPSTTVDALIGNQKVSDLTGGFRIPFSQVYLHPKLT